MSRCMTCGGEMGSAGCTQSWKHPRTVPAGWVPLSIRGNAAAESVYRSTEDLIATLTARAERAEARAEEMARHAEAMAGAIRNLARWPLPDPHGGLASDLRFAMMKVLEYQGERP